MKFFQINSKDPLNGPAAVVLGSIRKMWAKFILKLEIINEISSILEINFFDNF
jgi:hypothetical protein